MRLRYPPKGQPDECSHCFATVEYWDDPEGIWAECDCSAGYIS